MKPCDRRGFTLMEILVAMTLLSAVAAIAMSSFSNSTKVVPSNANTAFNVARGYLEQFYEYVREDWRPNNNIPLALSGSLLPSANPQALNGVTYTTTHRVNNSSGAMIDANGDGQEDYRKIDVTVTW